jgi:hypothetical protein
MANKVVLKRSAVEGKTPTTSDLALGELALNTFDGNLFFKKDVSGTESILSVATVTGTQTLTNKTLTSPTLTTPVFSSIVNTGTLTLPTSTDTLVGRATTDTLTNKTLEAAVLTSTLTAGGGVGSNGAVLTSTGTGVQWVTPTANTLDGLSDVVINSPEANEVLKYNGTIWVNGASDIDVSSAIFADGAQSDLGLVTDLILALSEDLGLVTDATEFIYNLGQLRVDGIVSLDNLDQSVKADYIAYSIIFGF